VRIKVIIVFLNSFNFPSTYSPSNYFEQLSIQTQT
jgi:hypothetical protein